MATARAGRDWSCTELWREMRPQNIAELAISLAPQGLLRGKKCVRHFERY